MDRRVAYTEVAEGRYVSTVRLLFRHQGGIYETMVFPRDSMTELDMARYETREEAEAGHAAMVARWRDGSPAETTTLLEHDGMAGVFDALRMVVPGFGEPAVGEDEGEDER